MNYNVAMKRVPSYLLPYASQEAEAFQGLLTKYWLKNSYTNVLDICAGTGRSVQWIRNTIPDVEVEALEIDSDCCKILESKGIPTHHLDMNVSWPLYQIYDMVTCFGGFNNFVNWSTFIENCVRVTGRGVFHFNRNDTKEAIKVYKKELKNQDYTYTAYNMDMIRQIMSCVHNVNRKIEIVDMKETPISILIYWEARSTI